MQDNTVSEDATVGYPKPNLTQLSIKYDKWVSRHIPEIQEKHVNGLTWDAYVAGATAQQTINAESDDTDQDDIKEGLQLLKIYRDAVALGDRMMIENHQTKELDTITFKKPS
jgi:hypothetical protein